jgi:hypothetical protein
VTGIRFYTRQGCPLCEEALEVTLPLAAAAGVSVDLIDIDLDLALLKAYNDRVPVIETENGEAIDEGMVDAAVVREFLGL